jgi:hypothetical protein
VTQVASAITAGYFRAYHTVADVRSEDDGIFYGIIEAWPAAAAIELIVRTKEGSATIRTGIITGVFVVEQGTAKGHLSGFVE